MYGTQAIFVDFNSVTIASTDIKIGSAILTLPKSYLLRQDEKTQDGMHTFKRFFVYMVYKASSL
jgi:hypothetical protein